jgi:hypothetical protein
MQWPGLSACSHYSTTILFPMTLAPVSGLWRAAWLARGFRMRVFVTAPALIIALVGLSRFLLAVERRPGSVLSDPLLMYFTPVDVNWVTFALIYGGIFVGIAILLRHPERCVLAFQSYIVMVVFRIIAMSLTPLDPPLTMISLRDPFVEYLGTGTMLTKDLFFSGHTSTMFLLFLAMPSKATRAMYLCCVIGVASCVLIQHAHYSIDVYAAVFFAFCANRVAQYVNAHVFPLITE